MKKGLVVLLAGLGACVAPPYEYVGFGPLHPPLHAREITRLADAGVSTDLVREFIDERGVHRLNADDLVAIKNAGYDDEMMRKMIEAERPDVSVMRSYGLYGYGYTPWVGGYSSYSYSSWGFGIHHR